MRAGKLGHYDAFVQASSWQKASGLDLMTPAAYTMLAQALELTTSRAEPLAELLGPSTYKMLSDALLLKNPLTARLPERGPEESKAAESRHEGRGGVRRLPPASALQNSGPEWRIRRQENGVLRMDGMFRGLQGRIDASFVLSLDHLHGVRLEASDLP